MTNDWKKVKIREIASVNELAISRDYPYGQIEYIDISSVDKGFVSAVQKLSLAEAPSRAKRIVRDSDILISTVRPNLEHYAFIKKARENTVASTGFAVISPKRVEPRYLYYYLTTSQFTAYLSAIADTHTSAYPAFNPDVIENAEVPVPPQEDQDGIANILGTLDDKIELNERMNQTLEAIAQAIFKSWFVDFDPVKAKSEGRDTGLPKEIDKLFPDSFEESELGPIPSDWELDVLTRVAEITMGQSPPGETYNEEGRGVPFYQGIKDFGFRFPQRRVYCTAPTRFAEKGDILLSVRAPIGELNMVIERCAIGRGIAVIRQKEGSNDFVFYLLKTSPLIWSQFEGGGTVFGCISKKDLHNFQIVVPKKALMQRFSKVVATMETVIEKNELELRTLAAIRDSLLPKLLSGQIKVKRR